MMDQYCAVGPDSDVGRKVPEITTGVASHSSCGRPAYRRVSERGLDGIWCCDPHADAYLTWPRTVVVQENYPSVPQEDVDEAVASILRSMQ